MQSGGEAVNGPAFDLSADSVWIDGTAPIHGINETVNFHRAFFHAGFGDGRGVGIERIKRGDASSLALWQRLSPASFLCGELQNTLKPSGIKGRLFFASELRNLAVTANEFQAKGQRILASGSRKLIDKAFHDKAAAGEDPLAFRLKLIDRKSTRLNSSHQIISH